MELYDGSLRNLGFCVCLLIAFVWLFGNLTKSWRLPPGPPRLPLLGNAFQVPLGKQWLTFSQWGEQYGMYSHTIQYVHE
jgi:hypothetical protein